MFVCVEESKKRSFLTMTCSTLIKSHKELRLWADDGKVQLGYLDIKEKNKG